MQNKSKMTSENKSDLAAVLAHLESFGRRLEALELARAAPAPAPAPAPAAPAPAPAPAAPAPAAPSPAAPAPAAPVDPAKQALVALKVAELKAKCKESGLARSGKKEDLIARLMAPAAIAKKKRSASSKPSKSSEVLERLEASAANSLITVKCKGNKHVHEGTGMVFRKEDSTVVGTYNTETHETMHLTEDDLETCRRMNFSFVVPPNLTDAVVGSEDSLDEDEPSDIELGSEVDL